MNFAYGEYQVRPSTWQKLFGVYHNFLKKYLFTYLFRLCRVLVVAHRIFVVACMRDLVPRPGIEPGPLALGVRSLTHWATRQVPTIIFKSVKGFWDQKAWESLAYRTTPKLVNQILGIPAILLQPAFATSLIMTVSEVTPGSSLTTYLLISAHVLHLSAWLCACHSSTWNTCPHPLYPPVWWLVGQSYLLRAWGWRDSFRPNVTVCLWLYCAYSLQDLFICLP